MADGANNIEAGIILQEGGKIKPDQYSVLDFEKFLMSKEEYEQDREKPASEFSFSVKVSFDWSEKTYSLESDASIPEGRYSLTLPDINGPIALPATRRIPLPMPDRILRDHVFFIREKDETVFAGVIIEENRQDRCPWRFDSLTELFQSFIKRESPEERGGSVLHAPAKQGPESGVDEDPGLVGDPGTMYPLSYFQMFMGFENYRDILKNCKRDKSGKPLRDELRRHLDVYPGSIRELSQKMDELLKEDPPRFSKVYLWFMVNELNSLVSLWKSFLPGEKDEISDLSGKADACLLVPIELGLSAGKEEQYRELVRKACGYEVER
jgi:hypothetical protein